MSFTNSKVDKKRYIKPKHELLGIQLRFEKTKKIEYNIIFHGTWNNSGIINPLYLVQYFVYNLLLCNKRITFKVTEAHQCVLLPHLKADVTITYLISLFFYR